MMNFGAGRHYVCCLWWCCTFGGVLWDKRRREFCTDLRVLRNEIMFFVKSIDML